MNECGGFRDWVKYGDMNGVGGRGLEFCNDILFDFFGFMKKENIDPGVAEVEVGLIIAYILHIWSLGPNGWTSYLQLLCGNQVIAMNQTIVNLYFL